MKIKLRKERLGLLIVSTVISLFLTILVSRISAMGRDITVGEILLNTSQVAGVIVAVRLISLIMMVFSNRKIGPLISYLIIVTSIIPIIISLIHSRYDAIPGFANAIVSICIVALVTHFLVLEDKQKKFLETIADQEPLTGMHNRRCTNKEIQRLLDDEKPFYIAYFTIENFKLINDTIGRDYGDKVLIAVASRMQAFLREGEYSGKITGADFLVIIQTDTTENIIAERVREYINVLSKPIMIGNIETPLEIKCAVVASPKDGKDIDTIYRHLDGTLSLNKSTHEKKIFFFTDSITNEITEAFKIEDRLFKALDYNQLHLVFQPQFTADNKTLRGFETLSRLEDEDGKPIRPDKFIEVAERTNLIFKVDDWVLEHAIEMFKPIIAEHPDLILSVNISARHFQRPNYADYILKILNKHEYPEQNLEIEITETAFVENMEMVEKCLHKLRSVSVKVALDDFGTGYASLSYLSQLPINLLKIDKSFVDKISADGGVDNDFVQVIISMGHILKMEVISEGVELEEQRNLLNSWGCDLIQGYLWGKPVDYEVAKEIIEKAYQN